jgi:hypothetical protein
VSEDRRDGEGEDSMISLLSDNTRGYISLDDSSIGLGLLRKPMSLCACVSEEGE